MSRRKIESSRAMVTGASSGIGFELSKQLMQRGARVIATARRQEKLDELVKQAPSREQLEIVCGDITDPLHREKLIETASDRFGGLDILINNAGVGALGKFESSSSACLKEVMEVNFFAPVELIRVALPILKQGVRPIIVNICSVLGHRAVPEKSEYCASKFALHGFSDSLRAELGGMVDVLLVSPSTTQSDFFEHAVENHSQRDWTPKKAMTPEVVARKTIQAIRGGKHEVVLSWGGKGLVLMDRLVPTLADRIVQKFG